MSLSNGPSSSAPPAPPPPPPRPSEMNTGLGVMPTYGMYGNTMGYSGPGYGMNSYGVGMYGGMYGNGMMGGYGGQYGHCNPESSFARLAEESSRGAFQSIEAIVNAVTSVANMLSSTHNAVYSSFRAVIGVVEQLSRLKLQLAQVLFSLSLFKFIQKLWRYLLVLLRLKPANYASVEEMAWGEIKQPYGSDLLAGPGPRAVNWPAIMFWLVALGGPYLIYKAISQMVRSFEESRKWATGTGAHYTARALYDFHAANDQELSFMSGELLRVAPKEEQPRVRGWLLASSQEGDRVGLVPINYVKIVGRKSESPPLREPIDNLSRFDMAFKPPS
uniref:Peroxisomal membrane protein PEX13 n=1 Tax=Haemonchus contortus TaxID=6289 RepID=W6NCH8_HAECO